MNKLKFGKLDIQFYDIDLISKEARKESYMMQAHKWDEFIMDFTNVCPFYFWK